MHVRYTKLLDYTFRCVYDRQSKVGDMVTQLTVVTYYSVVSCHCIRVYISSVNATTVSQARIARLLVFSHLHIITQGDNWDESCLISRYTVPII